jgi:hypothetical protein
VTQTTGGIVFGALIRAAIVVPLAWWLRSQLDYQLWWLVGAALVYGGVIHPAIVQYRRFREEVEPLRTGTLCASCAHFDETAALCMKYDEHPTLDYVPCGGRDWEPASEGTYEDYDEYDY